MNTNGTSLMFKIDSRPVTLNERILKSPLMAAAEAVDANEAAAATRLKMR